MKTSTLLAVVGFVAGVAVSGCEVGDKSAGSGNGTPTGTRDRTPDAGTDDGLRACTRNSDCPAPQVCRAVAAGRTACVPQCREDFDCCEDPTELCGRVCREQRCVAGESETCDGVDNDADGVTDEGFDLDSNPEHCGRCGLRCDAVLAHVRPGGTTCARGVCQILADGCADGFRNVNGAAPDGCEYGCFVTNGGVEEPDGDDNDCDGAVDEGFACARGDERSCGSGTGICEEGVQRCASNGTWSGCIDAAGPRDEFCNRVDDDCDGVADDGFDLASDPVNCGVCGLICANKMPHADTACVSGACRFIACADGFRDVDGEPSNGCETCDVWPPTGEACDAGRVDEDCDGEVNEGCDCADGDDRPCGIDPALNGVGICRFGVEVCTDGVWGACEGAQGPLALEVCNGLDDDCDGIVPFAEVDGDTDGFSACAGDCDDADALVSPNIPELCDGDDQDCDGRTDEDFFAGAPCRGVGACAGVAGGIVECADLVQIRCSLDVGGSAYGGVPEVANNRDDDCDGTADEGFACATSDPRPCGPDPALHGVGICRLGSQRCVNGQWGSCAGAQGPLPAERCNGLDDDCDGAVPADEVDADGDRYAPCAGDCDDTANAIHPGADDTCDGADQDCDGVTDEKWSIGAPCDGEGACGRGVWECDGARESRCSTNPGGSAYPNLAPSEVCANDIDDDCDGDVDEGCGECEPGEHRDCGLDRAFHGVGVCRVGVQVCDGSRAWGACAGAVAPSAELCNMLDDDCDGITDNACTECAPGIQRPCGLDLALHGSGRCVVGIQMCAANGRWSVCFGARGPTAELCNGLDDDCDGIVPFAEVDGDRDGYAPCAGDCDDRDPDVRPGSPEVCNGIDDDCVGGVDEAFFVGAPCDGIGECGVGALECASTGATRCSTDPGGSEDDAVVEAANNRDDDCDGSTDEGFTCAASDPRPCGIDPALHGVGICRFGSQYCVGGQWGACADVQASLPAEACNGLDDDCDGAVPANELDGDRDGVRACDGDCDDARRAVSPDTHEVCNGVDDDCDGDVDEDFSIGASCAGEGACGTGELECRSAVSIVCSTDPGGSADESRPEVCNDRDDDCDGQVDDIAPSVVASDPANCGACGVSCAAPNAIAACVDGACVLRSCDTGFRLVGGSCLRCEVWPPIPERCDSGFLDDDCDGERNETCDCTDGAEVPCGIDRALHGRGLCHFGAQACVDGAWGPCTEAVAPSIEVCNGLDDDCSGGIPFSERDGDDDRFTPCAGDCNDADASVRPNASEVCNGFDDDCDGAIDEGFAVGSPCNVGDLFGAACRGGVIECDPADPSVARCSTSPGGSMYPAVAPAEVCANDRDDDCDRSVDEGCGGCAPGDPRPCGLDPLVLHNVGECRVGIQRCSPDGTWGPCAGSTPPASEACNGLDDDCDAVVDDGFDFLADIRNCGACGVDCTALPEIRIATCAFGRCAVVRCRSGWHDLNGDTGDGCEYGCFVTKGGTEDCDGIDNDCDGAVDEAPACVPPPLSTAAFTFSVTLPATFPLDASAELCQTFDDGSWSCGDYPLTVNGTTLSASGIAQSGFHIFNVCTSHCATPSIATWLVYRDGSGTLTEAATPTVTYNGVAVALALTPNASGGGNEFTTFP